MDRRDPTVRNPVRHEALKRAIKQTTIALLLLAALFFMTYQGQAQEVKYCRDARTGDIIVVPAGTPCPYPTHAI